MYLRGKVHTETCQVCVHVCIMEKLGEAMWELEDFFFQFLNSKKEWCYDISLLDCALLGLSALVDDD